MIASISCTSNSNVKESIFIVIPMLQMQVNMVPIITSLIYLGN